MIHFLLRGPAAYKICLPYTLYTVNARSVYHLKIESPCPTSGKDIIYPLDIYNVLSLSNNDARIDNYHDRIWECLSSPNPIAFKGLYASL